MKAVLFIASIMVQASASAATLTAGTAEARYDQGVIVKAELAHGTLTLQGRAALPCQVSAELAAKAGLSLGDLLAAARRPGVTIHCQFTGNGEHLASIDLKEQFLPNRSAK